MQTDLPGKTARDPVTRYSLLIMGVTSRAAPSGKWKIYCSFSSCRIASHQFLGFESSTLEIGKAKMDHDLENMSRDELKKLLKDVERALATVDERRRSEARSAAEKAAREHGFSLDDVIAGQKKGGSRKKNPPKYRNPENPSQTWSGRGRQPGWIKDALENGKSLDGFAI